MIRNYALDGDTILVFDGKEFDIHNDFVLKRVEFDFENMKLYLNFKGTYNENLQMYFEGVVIFKIKERSVFYPNSESGHVNLIGFAPAEEIESMDSYSPDYTGEDYHLLLLFQDEAAIKIYAERSTASLTGKYCG